MAEAKTKPTGASVDAYVAAIVSPVRRMDCEALIVLMSKITKCKPVMWGPSIVGFGNYHYRYASGREGDSCPIGFSSGRAHLTIYLASGFEGTESILAELGKFRTSKVCLYVKRLSDIDMKVLEKLLRFSATETKRRYP